MGLEKYIFPDLTKCTVYEWGDECFDSIRELGATPIKADIRELPSIKADIVSLFDVLEHITKDEALSVLSKIDAKQILMFVPIQPEYRKPIKELLLDHRHKKSYNKRLSEHLSLWTPKELEDLGFKVWYKEGYHKKHNNWGACIAIKTL